VAKRRELRAEESYTVLKISFIFKTSQYYSFFTRNSISASFDPLSICIPKNHSTPEHYYNTMSDTKQSPVSSTRARTSTCVIACTMSSDEESCEEEIPECFTCPLTLEIMEDPLMDRRGNNFERGAIVEWLNRGNTTCPLTRQPLTYSKLIPNAGLRTRIERWKRDKGMIVPSKTDEKPSTSLCMIEAPPNSLMEMRLNYSILASFAFDASNDQQQQQQPRSGRRSRRGSLQNDNYDISPATRRRRLTDILDSALSALRRSPGTDG
jgi:hypothetical protein